MNYLVHLLLVVAIWKTANSCDHYEDSKCVDFEPMNGNHFVNQWIVEIPGGEEVAKAVADETKFQYLRPAKDHDDHYIFTHTDVPNRHRMMHEKALKTLQSHKKIEKVSQQYVWKAVLHDLDNYDDFVGYDHDVSVGVSSFDPEKRAEFYENLKNERNVPSYEDDQKANESEADEARSLGENGEDVDSVIPLSEEINIKGLYKLKEDMRAKRREKQHKD